MQEDWEKHIAKKRIFDECYLREDAEYLVLALHWARTQPIKSTVCASLPAPVLQ